jgi:GDP-mannose 6-dehydrogenase
MKVSVFGLGYVGCVTAACLASRGHHVLGVDINPDKVEVVNRGGSPIIERGLAELIRAGRGSGNLSATGDAAEAVAFAEIILVCVGTPSNSNGNLNFKFVDRVCAEIGESLSKSEDYKVIAIRSTLLPGVISERLLPLLAKGSGKQVGKDFGMASNPEFLREGSAIADFNDPPFTIVGTDDERAGSLLGQLYEGVAAPVIRTDLNTASMIKYACNAFHGLKVVFANEIGQLCKRSGVDGRQVMDVLVRIRA